MRWYTDYEKDEIRGTVTVPAHFNGYPGITHGGIVAAILDETAGRSIYLRGDDELFMVTLKLDVSYRRPTPTGQPLTAIGKIQDFKPTRAKVSAELRTEDGTVTAKAEGIVVRPPDSFLEGWEKERQYWFVDGE